MSFWKTIKNKEYVEVSDDGSTLDVLYDSDQHGNMYLEIPIEFVIEAIKSRNDVQEG